MICRCSRIHICARQNINLHFLIRSFISFIECFCGYVNENKEIPFIWVYDTKNECVSLRYACVCKMYGCIRNILPCNSFFYCITFICITCNISCTLPNIFSHPWLFITFHHFSMEIYRITVRDMFDFHSWHLWDSKVVVVNFLFEQSN